jgi:hypothetical protein
MNTGTLLFQDRLRDFPARREPARLLMRLRAIAGWLDGAAAAGTSSALIERRDDRVARPRIGPIQFIGVLPPDLDVERNR